MIQYVTNDGNDEIYGYSDRDTIEIINGNYTTQTSGQDVVINVDSGGITLKDAKGTKFNIKSTTSSSSTGGGSSTSTTGGGSSTSTTGGGSSTSTTSGGSGTSTNTSTSTTLTVTNSTKSPVTVGSAIKTINASSRTTAVKIVGNSLANSIIGGSGADSLSGGAGADTLNGGKGNDTLTGGTGKDVFFFASSDGNDVITDYSATQGDLIRLGTSSMSTSTSGNNVILKVGTGKITINNAKSQKVSVVGSNGKSTVIGGTASTTLTVTNSTKSPVTVNSVIKTIDASKRTTAVKITGNALANSIKGGSGVDNIYGGNGNDSISGNNGNDKLFGDAGNDTLNGGTLAGGAGADVFVYATGDGNDVITDYTVQDKLRISCTYSTLTSGNDVVVRVGSGRMTLKNAKGVKLNITRASKYEERWFTEDDTNFTTSEVSSILKSDNLISNDYKLEGGLQLNQTNSASIITSLTYGQSKKA